VIGKLGTLWREGETDRYEPCGRHRGALDRMEYEEAWDYAAKCCDNCVAEVRRAEDEECVIPPGVPPEYHDVPTALQTRPIPSAMTGDPS
jgi:hypothetical protein